MLRALHCRLRVVASTGDDLVNPWTPRPHPAKVSMHGLAAVSVNVQRCRRHAAEKTSEGVLTLHRIIKPVRPDTTSPCCGHTTISVRQIAGSDPHAPPTCAIMGVRTCGRPVRIAGHKCGNHQRARRFEVWAVRRARVQPPAAPGQPHHGTSSADGPMQAALLFACNTIPQLAAFFSVAPDKLGFVDHWGQFGVRYEDVVAAPGIRVEERPPGQQQDLPAWRR